MEAFRYTHAVYEDFRNKQSLVQYVENHTLHIVTLNWNKKTKERKIVKITVKKE